jgi:hypothetical protein
MFEVDTSFVLNSRLQFGHADKPGGLLPGGWRISEPITPRRWDVVVFYIEIRLIGIDCLSC